MAASNHQRRRRDTLADPSVKFFDRLKLGNRRSLRGRVSRTAIVKGGEISVTVRFGLEELEDAKRLVPGLLIELVEVREDKPKEKT